MSACDPLRTLGKRQYANVMSRWLPLLSLCLASCGHRPPTAEECTALSDPKAVIDRCYGGDLRNGKYIGDLKCLPYGASERLRGLWLIDLETSEFFPNAKTVKANKDSPIWLETDLLNRPSGLLDAAQGAGRRVYVVEFQGRQSLCDGGAYGHMGMFPKQVIVERFYSIKPLAPPTH
jgi:hypothetical protein